MTCDLRHAAPNDERDGQPDPEVVFCACITTDAARDVRMRDTRRELERSGVPFREASDFCRAIAGLDPEMANRLSSRPVLLIACRPRAVKWMLDYAAMAVHPGFASLDFLAIEPGEIARRAGEFLKSSTPRQTGQTCPTGLTGPKESPSAPDWHPWFPVIDRDRCTKCGQCAKYCLFDTYEVREDGTVVVARPANCKTNCPACARICPEAALLFPKCPESLINGDVVADPDAVRKDQAQRLEQFAQGDLRSALARRRARIPLLKSSTPTPTGPSGNTP